MIEMKIEGGALVLKLRGWDKIWALKSELWCAVARYQKRAARCETGAFPARRALSGNLSARHDYRGQLLAAQRLGVLVGAQAEECCRGRNRAWKISTHFYRNRAAR